LAAGIVGNAVIDQNVEDAETAPRRLFILAVSALLMTTVLGVARLVRVIREIAELRLGLDDEEDQPSTAAD
jgi:hypothetical protein